jgi:beta-phosphoglucomutase
VKFKIPGYYNVLLHFVFINLNGWIFHKMAESNYQMGVIFDLDGVLVDTGWAHKQSWYDLAEKEGFSMTDEFFYNTFGMQNYMIIPILLGRDAPPDEVKRLSDWKEQRYRDIIAEKLAPAEGAKSLLYDLKSEGFCLAVGSSAPLANLELVLDCTDLQDYFDTYVTDQDVTNGKPAPDTFLKAAEKLSLKPKSCVVVEDAVQGVEAGKAAGMPVVAVTTTRSRNDLYRADLIVDNLAQLRARHFIELLRNQKD